MRPRRRQGSIRRHGRGSQSVHFRDPSQSRRGPAAALAALEANPYFKPIEQAHFGPAAETLAAGDLRRLAECDAVLHIVGECYGHEQPPCTKPRRSYTQLEHDDARAPGKPLFLFVCAGGFPYTPHYPEPADKRALQDAHRATILNGHDKYDLIAELAGFEKKIREVDLPFQRLLSERGPAEALQFLGSKRPARETGIQ